MGFSATYFTFWTCSNNEMIFQNFQQFLTDQKNQAEQFPPNMTPPETSY